MSELNLNQAGKWTGPITITKIEPQEKITWISVEGQTKKIKALNGGIKYFGKPLEVGATAEAEIEVEDHPEYGVGALLRSFGGRKGGGVGSGARSGGSTYTPKEFYAELAPSIGGIYGHGIDKGLKLGDIEDHARSYAAIMTNLRNTTMAKPAPTAKESAPAANTEAPKTEPKTNADPLKPGKDLIVSVFGDQIHAREEFIQTCKGSGYKSSEIALALVGQPAVDEEKLWNAYFDRVYLDLAKKLGITGKAADGLRRLVPPVEEFEALNAQARNDGASLTHLLEQTAENPIAWPEFKASRPVGGRATV